MEIPTRAVVVRGAGSVSLAFLFAVLTACDGSLTVSGFVPESDCTLALWTMAGPVLQAKERTLVRKATVSRAFEVEWTLSGTHSPHWLTIDCPLGETFESERFEAGRAGERVDLGRVRLKPPSTSPAPP